MKKASAYIHERDKAFYEWFLTRTDEKTVADTYSVLPFINNYGIQHKLFSNSVLEIEDVEDLRKFQSALVADKRLKFMYFGNFKRALSLLDYYFEFIDGQQEESTNYSEKHETASQNTESKDPNPQSKIDKDEIDNKVGNSEKRQRLVIIRTLNGKEYEGDIPAEALAELCEALAQKYPDTIKKLLFNKVLSSGSCESRIPLKCVNGFIDKALSDKSVMRYARWLCDSCGETDLPETIIISTKETENAETSIHFLTNELERLKSQSKENGRVNHKYDESSSRKWSKYEVALLIEAYQNVNKNGNLRVEAEKLSHKLREMAIKKGKTIDDSYRNLNGIIMQLGTVQYCFTNGQSGLSNASAQIHEMVDLYKNNPKEFNLILEDAHQLVKEPMCEVVNLLKDERYASLRETLVKEKITTINQLDSLDLWAFMNKHGLYFENERQEISDNINALIHPGSTTTSKKHEIETDSENPKTATNLKEKETNISDWQKNDLNHENEKNGEAWLFENLSKRNLRYDDKRNIQGCLWILAGHELDEFMEECKAKGYRFVYKGDGYRTYRNGPVWWTTDYVASGKEEIKENDENNKIEEKEKSTVSLKDFRHWLDGDFKSYMLDKKNLSARTTSQYSQSIEAIERFIRDNYLPLTLVDITASEAENVKKHLSKHYAFVAWNKRGHNQYSAALAQYIDYLQEDRTRTENVQHVKSNHTINEVTEKEHEKTEDKLTDKKTITRDESQDVVPESDYNNKQAEQVIRETDLDGIKVDDLSEIMNKTVAATKRIIEKNNNIVNICGKLIHKDAFVDWVYAADQLKSILSKLIEKNNGYVSRSQLFEYARADLQMFMNDNDMNTAQKIYDLAKHLFSKEQYDGVEYSFSNDQHISKPEAEMLSLLDVILNFAREQGGIFNEDDMISYLESVKIKTANIRNGIMHIYEKPTFLFYDYHMFVLSECLEINDKWLAEVNNALDRLFADMGDHVILRDIQPNWYAQLPSLPGDKPWTGILLQSILLHYGKKLGGAKTIYAYQSLSGDYLQSMLVSADSEVQTFNDAVIAVLIDGQIEKREFESAELRQILIERGLIGNADLTGRLSKYIESDERFVWSGDGQHVSIRI